MSRKRALVVDNCRMTTLLLRHVLSQENVESDAAVTGEEGLSKAREIDYNWVFVELELERLSGIEFARRLHDEVDPTIPVILVTSSAEGLDFDVHDDPDLRGVLFKPINPVDVSRLVDISQERDILSESDPRDTG